MFYYSDRSFQTWIAVAFSIHGPIPSFNHTHNRALNLNNERLHIMIEVKAFGNGMRMQHSSITEIQKTYSEVLDQAAVEPVLLTTESQPSYVICRSKTMSN